MTDQDIIFKAIGEVVSTENPSEFAAHNSTCYTIAKYVCEELREQLSNESAEKPNFKVKYAEKVYDVIGVRELSNGHIMYGILDGPTINYVNKDSCEVIVSEELAKVATQYAWSHSTVGCTIDDKQYRVPCGEQMKTAVIFGANWEKNQLIEKACEWLKNNGGNSIYYDERDHAFVDTDELVENFKEAMKG